MAARSDRVDAAKIAELKLLYERGWLGQYCSNILADWLGIHREGDETGEDALMRLKRKQLQRSLNQNQHSPEWIEKGGKAPPLPLPLPHSQDLPPGPPPGSGCDVMLSRLIVANPPGTPIEAPAAMRPDSPAAPRQPDPTSLRGRIEALLVAWETDRCKDLQAADDPSLPDEVRAGARRAADIGGLYINELDAMYDEYVRAIA